MRIIIDVNLWISFCIGQHVEDLPILLGHPSVKLYVCEDLEREFDEVSKRPRLKKYIRPERLEEVYQLMESYAIKEKIEREAADFIDAKDNYLLDFSQSVDANYLVTGDQNLLALGAYFETKIIAFKSLVAILQGN